MRAYIWDLMKNWLLSGANTLSAATVLTDFGTLGDTVALANSGIIDIDYTGSQLLQRTIADLKAKGFTVAIAWLSHEQAQREAGQYHGHALFQD